MITIRWAAFTIAMITAGVMIATPSGFVLWLLSGVFGLFFLLFLGTFPEAFGFLHRSWWVAEEPPTSDHLTRLDDLDRHR